MPLLRSLNCLDTAVMGLYPVSDVSAGYRSTVSIGQYVVWFESQSHKHLSTSLHISSHKNIPIFLIQTLVQLWGKVSVKAPPAILDELKRKSQDGPELFITPATRW